ncbi:MAG TPA: hypothetical protein VGP47_11495, partial [Parachlamydiaceae bacterium]|nr:hypothetical protein [Parachlamydiaceae bacterium]
ICAQSAFAYAHLGNGGKNLSILDAIRQAAKIMLFPIESILYETTGGMAASLGAHITNNFAAEMAINLLVFSRSIFTNTSYR